MKGVFIPEDTENWLEFYHKERAKGYKVRSRYKGVCININHQRPAFFSQYYGRGNRKFLGRFPLTKEGELTAFRKYMEFLETLPSNSKARKRIMKDKINSL
jgi:hypothetical protein